MKRIQQIEKERAELSFADLTSHHIEGMNPITGAHLKIPLISHIEDHLWTGGCIQDVRLPDHIKHVVSLYPWEQYDLGPDTDRVEFRLYDGKAVPDPEDMRLAVNTAEEFLKDGDTLIHCQAGLNRSNLIAACVLINGGRTPEEAIALLREKRSSAVLFNKVFHQWLLDGGWNSSK